MDRPVTVVVVHVPWREHNEVYELYRFLRAALASDGVAVHPQSRTTWFSPARLTLRLGCEPAEAEEAVRRALQDAPVRVASVDVMIDGEVHDDG